MVEIEAVISKRIEEKSMFQFKEKIREVKNMEELKGCPVSWLWYPYIPFGRITVLHGVPGSGKSMFAARLSAACTRQKEAGDERTGSAGNVLYITADDELSDRLQPRLLEAGADLSRVYAINDMLPFTLGDDSIERIVENFDIRLMVVDPIQEYLEYEIYEDEPELTYPILFKLDTMAKKSGCAVILAAYSDGPFGENSKRWGEDFSDRIGSLLCVDRENWNSKQYRLIHEKCLFAPEGREQSFSLERCV